MMMMMMMRHGVSGLLLLFQNEVLCCARVSLFLVVSVVVVRTIGDAGRAFVLACSLARLLACSLLSGPHDVVVMVFRDAHDTSRTRSVKTGRIRD